MGCSNSTGKARGIQVFSGGDSTRRRRINALEEIKLQPADFVLHKFRQVGSDYRLHEIIGTGAYGNVKRAVHKVTAELRAIKTVKKMIFTGNFIQDNSEIVILKRLDHPNILKIYEFYEEERFYHIVTDYLQGGELFDYVTQQNTLTESVAAHFFRQLLSAVSYCHSAGIVHRDLKLENLILDSSSPDALLKVIDFGLSQTLQPDESINKVVGTPYYIAPEVLSGSYNSKCDIWSCGVILYVLLSGRPPFRGQNRRLLVAAISRGKFSMERGVWPYISKEAKELISAMLTFNPEKRPTAVEVLNFPWFRLELRGALPAEVLRESFENLCEFRVESKLGQVIYTFIVSQLLSVEDTKLLGESFGEIDANGDGKLSREELLKGYGRVFGEENASECVEEVFNKLDVNSDGYLNYSEFIMGAVDREKALSKQNLEKAFLLFDGKQKGYISVANLKKMLGSEQDVSQNILEELIREADQNRDGIIDLREFKDLMVAKFN